jgi:hypothetical protein
MANDIKYQSPRTGRPRCQEHGKLLRVETSRGRIAYAYCSVTNCKSAAKVIRRPVAGSKAV